MSTGMFSLSLSLAADNVVRGARKKTSMSASPFPPQSQYDPDAVALDDVTAGFNSVIEIAAGYCLRQYADQMAMPDFTVGILPDDLREFLASQKNSFQSPYINALTIPDGVKTYFYTLCATFETSDIEFSAPHQVCVTYKASAFLQREDSPSPSFHFPSIPASAHEGFRQRSGAQLLRSHPNIRAISMKVLLAAAVVSVPSFGQTRRLPRASDQ